MIEFFFLFSKLYTVNGCKTGEISPFFSLNKYIEKIPLIFKLTTHNKMNSTEQKLPSIEYYLQQLNAEQVTNLYVVRPKKDVTNPSKKLTWIQPKRVQSVLVPAKFSRVDSRYTLPSLYTLHHEEHYIESDQYAMSKNKHMHQKFQNKVKWTEEENCILKEFQSQHGNKWTVLSKQLPGRSPIAIKSHFRLLKRNRSM